MPVRGIEDSYALELFEQYLRTFLEHNTSCDPLARQISHHFALDAPQEAIRGKRLRPRLVMAAAASYGARPERVLAACTAIELLHNYSLVHDDIEDGDQLRHGRQTLWVKFGLPHGVNAGDAIGALAQLALAPTVQTHGAAIAFDMSMDLGRANVRMCEGQALDLALESGLPANIDVYVAMIEGKTAALFGCAAALGARCAGASEDEVELCWTVGRNFGLGFQIRDDVVGIWGNTAQTGKIAAGDLSRRKKTFPVIWALEHDPVKAGSAIQGAYGNVKGPSHDEVEGLRTMLEACGSYRAACSAADNYFESARKLAQGMEPLSDFVLQNRT
ncbi:MAG: polyprenyl synthetase family protein [Candidatus Eremiobacteraeota bacterium]|nr:polyprenyl synthetase family protein [Candidatus Eremiobacteraeota bacterium]